MAKRDVKANGNNGDGSQPPDLDEGFLVVGIGASAGGIQALSAFFAEVTEYSDMAYVVILHLSPDHESHLAHVLQQASKIPVHQVTSRTKVAPNNVYVVSPKRSLRMDDGHITARSATSVEDRRAPVDIFFRTLAQSHGPNSVGVVLSGTGADGSMGLKRIKEMGGTTIVQSPAEAEYGEMPRNSIATELVDTILPVAQIPGHLIAYRNNRVSVSLPDQVQDLPDTDQAALRDIFTELRVGTGHDFSSYKRPTIMRRIERRISVNNLPNLQAYAAHLQNRPEESQSLLKDLLISVTNFFRDKKAFRAFEKRIIPRLLQKPESEWPIRVWVAGCATGEEAYSLAMLFLEHTSGNIAAPPVQIFATDLDEAALAVARDGLYSLNHAADVSPERLKRFFNKEGENYRVTREIRELVLFAHHNLIKDPPFSQLDLITCRNLLIYFNQTAQARAMGTFHFALRPAAYLFVGSSESLESSSDLFAAVDKENHIYQSREVAPRRMPMPEASRGYRMLMPAIHRLPEDSPPPERPSFGELHLRLLEEYAPPSIVVNESFDMVHLSPRAGKYLEVLGGEPSKNIFRMLKPEIRVALRTALAQATEERTNISAPVELQFGDVTERLNLLVRPVINERDTARGFTLIIFEPSRNGDRDDTAPVYALTDDAAARLEQELMRSKTQLQAALAQSEVQAEELQASNEELLAINEELRSTAEELDTSREELQSINEELTTVNEELNNKIDELSQTNNNFQNLINSIDIGTVFLDRSFRVSLYSPAARDIFNFRDNDTSRPITDITNRLDYDNLLNDAAHVLETLHMLEREVGTKDHTFYIMRIYPYRTERDKINGVVITFVDITERRRLAESLLKSEEQLRRTIQDAPIPIIMHAEDGEVLQVSRSWTELTGYKPNELPTFDAWLTTAYGEGADEVRAYMKDLFRGSRKKLEVDFRIKTREGIRYWTLSASAPGTLLDGRRFVIGMALDITDRHEIARVVNADRASREALVESEERLRQVVESVTDYAIFTMTPDRTITSWNSGAERIFKWTGEEAIGKSADIIFTDEDIAEAAPEMEMQTAILKGRAPDERLHVDKHGNQFYVSGVMTRVNNTSGEIQGFAKICRDMTERREVEKALLDKEMLQKLVNAQEEERKRFARDLHDELGQQLTVLRMKLDSLRSSCTDAETRGKIDEVQTLAQSVDEGVDFLAWEMRPAALDDLGLVVALDKFTKQWSYHTGVDAELIASTLRHVRFDPNIEINIYRISQEALNNVQKHAKAKHVDVMLERRGSSLVLVIEDDGKGFNRKNKKFFSKGMGLTGMRERAELIGGKLEIESTGRKGTTIFVSVPAAPIRRTK
jgi:two-component system CheB/CheR fusion protein